VVFVCARTARMLWFYVIKYEAKCTLLIVRHFCCCFVQYFNCKYLFLNLKFETLFFCHGIVFNLFLNFEQQ